MTNGETKAELRRIGRQLRKSIDRRDERSRAVLRNLRGLQPFARASRILYYVSLDDEVDTHQAIRDSIDQKIEVCVPYCVGEQLVLARITGWDELEARTLGILEPTDVIRDDHSRRRDVNDIDVVIVPGVAFGHGGERIGFGRGYYDRLLRDAEKEVLTIGLAFDCQLLDSIPMTDRDIWLDFVITENHILARGGAERSRSN